ncbi:hypothetical protein FBZ99_1031, partial [Rhizobium sp. ERR 1071]
MIGLTNTPSSAPTGHLCNFPFSAIGAVVPVAVVDGRPMHLWD